MARIRGGEALVSLIPRSHPTHHPKHTHVLNLPTK